MYEKDLGLSNMYIYDIYSHILFDVIFINLVRILRNYALIHEYNKNALYNSSIK